jgi:tRNA modification GTPase
MASGERVLLLGEPNVGKSTLSNRLLGIDRSIVTAEAGTTRDLVEDRAALLGFPFRIIDAAGLRESSDSVEQEGVKRARLAASLPGIRLLLVDGSQTEANWESLRAWAGSPKSLGVLTKQDLPAAITVEAAEEELGIPFVPICSLEQSSLHRLLQQILFRSSFAGPPSLETPAPFEPYQKEALRIALQCAENGDRDAAAQILQEVATGGIPITGDNRVHEARFHQHRRSEE